VGDKQAKMMEMTRKHGRRSFAGAVAAGLLGALVLAAPGGVRAQADCGGLPKSAQKPRTCNPQEECLKLIPAGLDGKARAAATRECQRQPTSGVCYGPDVYNPQADCREKNPTPPSRRR
jgi:hypothetical protein